MIALSSTNASCCRTEEAIHHEFALSIFLDREIHARWQIIEAFKAKGLSIHAAQKSLRTLLKSNKIQRVDNGYYSLTGTLSAVPHERINRKLHSELQKIINDTLKDGKTHAWKDLKQIVCEKGGSQRQLATVIRRMVEGGKLIRVAQGQYKMPLLQTDQKEDLRGTANHKLPFLIQRPITILELREKTGVSRQRIYQLIKDGILSGEIVRLKEKGVRTPKFLSKNYDYEGN